MSPRQYKKVTTELLHKRAAGLLSDEEEEQFLERLDDIWHALTWQEQVDIDTWVRRQVRQQNKPSSDLPRVETVTGSA